MKISLAKKDGKAVFGVYNDSEPLTDEEKRKKSGKNITREKNRQGTADSDFIL